MSPQSSSNRLNVVKVVLTAALLLLAAITFGLGSGFFYNHWYNVPDLTYEVLPTYELQGVSFAGLVVENRGRATAHKVLINLGDLHTNIQQFDVQCPEIWTKEDGGTETDTLVLSLERMAKGSSLTTYLLTDDEAQLDGLAVMADEGRGHLAADERVSQLSLSGFLLAGLALAAIVTLANIGITSIRTIRARSRASGILLEFEDTIITQDSEIQSLSREIERLGHQLHDRSYGERTLPPKGTD